MKLNASVPVNMKGSLFEIETDKPNLALATLKKKFGASRVSLFGDKLHLVTENEAQEKEAKAELENAGVKVTTWNPAEFSLEDVFISLIESRRESIPL